MLKQIEEVAQMMNEDALRKGMPVKTWAALSEAGKSFWRQRAEAFILSCSTR